MFGCANIISIFIIVLMSLPRLALFILSIVLRWIIKNKENSKFRFCPWNWLAVVVIIIGCLEVTPGSVSASQKQQKFPFGLCPVLKNKGGILILFFFFVKLFQNCHIL